MQAFLRNSDSAIKFCIILHDLTGFLLTHGCDALQQSRGSSQAMEQYLLAYMTTQQGIRLLPLWLKFIFVLQATVLGHCYVGKQGGLPQTINTAALAAVLCKDLICICCPKFCHASCYCHMKGIRA